MADYPNLRKWLILKIAEINEMDPSLRVEGRIVKLLICGEPKGILSDSKGFMVGVSIWPAGIATPPPHDHEAEELYLILEGEGELLQGGETRKVKKGTAVFHPSRVKHGIVTVDETMTLLWILSPGGTYPHLPS